MYQSNNVVVAVENSKSKFYERKQAGKAHTLAMKNKRKEKQWLRAGE